MLALCAQQNGQNRLSISINTMQQASNQLEARGRHPALDNVQLHSTRKTKARPTQLLTVTRRGKTLLIAKNVLTKTKALGGGVQHATRWGYTAHSERSIIRTALTKTAPRCQTRPAAGPRPA